MASVFGEQERQIIRSRVNAGLERVRVQGTKLGHPKKGVAEDRGRHQEASERREQHPQGGCAGRRRKRNCAASEEGDGRGVG
jgi:DNA invertase Pin-like site-specific DNA recombinase